MAQKTTNYTTILRYSTNDSSYTDLADLRKVKPGGMELGEVDLTALDSANGYKETMAGWGQGTPATFTVFMTKTQLAALMVIWNARSAATSTQPYYYWRTVFPLIGAESTNSRHNFTGWLKSVDYDDLEAMKDEAIMVNFTIVKTGRDSFTAGT